MLWQPTRGIIQPNQHWRRPQTVAGGSWVPTDLGSALIAWFKADAGVYSDGGSTLATDTQTVQQWNDQSGNGYNISQATAGNRPTYNATGFNGGKTVTFSRANGTTLSTSTDAVAIGSGATGSAFMVGQMLTDTFNSGRVVSYLATGASADYTNSGSAAWLMRSSLNDAFGSYRNGSLRCSAAISLATNYRLGVIYDGTNVTPYINNVAGTAGAYTDSWASPGTLSIGAHTTTDGLWDGPISEVIITNSALSSTDRNNLDSYFTTKWGL